MHEYELLIETINPCGGEAHAKKEFKEVFAESPENYVAQNGRYPVIDSGKNAAGDSVITTGDGKGILIRYTFTESSQTDAKNPFRPTCRNGFFYGMGSSMDWYYSISSFSFSKKPFFLGWVSSPPFSNFRSSSFCSFVSFVGVSTTTVTNWSPRVL